MPNPNTTASFWLDFADKVIKFLALLVGAAWTWMNYRRSRTYAQKLELQVDGNIVFKEDIYIEMVLSLKNLGASRHTVQKQGTSLTLWAIMNDLSETRIHTQAAFLREEWIEPGESIHDSQQSRVDIPREDIVWLKIELRVISKKAEWRYVKLVKVEPSSAASEVK